MPVQETPDMRREGIIVVQGASRSRSRGRGRARSRIRRGSGPEAIRNETGHDLTWQLG